MTQIQRLYDMMRRIGLVATRKAWVNFVRETNRRVDPSDWWPSQGYERVSVADGQHLLEDGRVVVRDVNGSTWVLRSDVYAKAVAEELAQAKTHAHSPETKSVVGTESLSAMVCPKCGDSLQYTAVCPKCAAGKLGYRHRYTCVCGGVDLISKEAL